MVCDSNILIDAAGLGDAPCQLLVQRPDALISSVTRVEVLIFPGFGMGRCSPLTHSSSASSVSSCKTIFLSEIRCSATMRNRPQLHPAAKPHPPRRKLDASSMP